MRQKHIKQCVLVPVKIKGASLLWQYRGALSRDQNQQSGCYLPGRPCRTRRQLAKNVDLKTTFKKQGDKKKP